MLDAELYHNYLERQDDHKYYSWQSVAKKTNMAKRKKMRQAQDGQ